MNMNQRFDEHIKNEFLDYTPQVHPRIWENIMKEREKKRPAGFWVQFFNRRNVLLLACLIAAGSGAFIFINKNNAAAGEKDTDITTATVKKTGLPVNNNTATPAGTTEKNNAAAAGKENTTADYTTGNNNNPVTANSINNITASKTTNNDNTYTPNNKLGKLTANVRQKIQVKNAAAFNDDDNTDDAATAGPKEYTLPFYFFTAEKNTGLKTESHLGKRTLANVTEPGCPSIEKNAAGNKTYVEVYGGPDYAFRSLSDTGNSVYLQKRKESTKFSSAFSLGVRYTKVFSNGVSIRTGINYSQINEKFIYSEGNIVQVVYIINANGDTIGSYTTTGSRYKTTHNKFRTIDVPLVLGYEMGNGKLHTNINAGVIVNAYSWQKGEVLDANLRPVNITTGKANSQYQFKTNIGVGFIGSVSLYYKLNEKLHLMAEPYFRYNLTPASKEEITFKQKYNTAGLRLGLRLDLK